MCLMHLIAATLRKKWGGADLDDVLEHHPEFREELANGCTIYACEEYSEATKLNTHLIAYYD